MAFTRFGGQFQFEKSMLGRLDNSGAGGGGGVSEGDEKPNCFFEKKYFSESV